MEGVTCAGWGPECFTGRDCQGNSGRNPGSETGGRSREGLAPCSERGLCSGMRRSGGPEVRAWCWLRRAGLAIPACTWMGGGVTGAQVNCLLWGLNVRNRVITGDCGDHRGSGRKAGQELLWDELKGGQADWTVLRGPSFANSDPGPGPPIC